jgi:hypothetical protein
MPIDISCPGCNRGYTLADELHGKKIRCKTCKTPFVVEPDDEIEDYGGDLGPPAPMMTPGSLAQESDAPPEAERKTKKKPRKKKRRRRASRESAVPALLSSFFGMTFWLIAIAIVVFSLAMHSRIGGVVAIVYAVIVIAMRREGLSSGEISLGGYLLLRLTSLLLMAAGIFSVSGKLDRIQQKNDPWAGLERHTSQTQQIIDRQNAQMEAFHQSARDQARRMRETSRKIQEGMRRNQQRNFPPIRIGPRRASNLPGRQTSSNDPPPAATTRSANNNSNQPPSDPDFFFKRPEGYEIVPEDVEIPDGTPVLATDGKWWYKAFTTREVGNIRLKFYLKKDRFKRESIRLRSELYIESTVLAKLTGEDGSQSNAAPARARAEFEKQIEIYTARESSYARLPRGFQQVSPELQLAESTPLLAKQGSSWVPVEVVGEEGDLVKVHWSRDRLRDDEAVDRTTLWIHEGLLESMAAVVELTPDDAAGTQAIESASDSEASHADADTSIPLDEDLRARHAEITRAKRSFRQLPREFAPLPASLGLPASTPLLAYWGSSWYPVEVLNDRRTRVEIHWVNYSDSFDEPLERSKLRIHKDLLKALRSD